MILFPEPILTVELVHGLGALTVDVRFELRAPWTMLFAPSGSGKTTVLRTVAGFVWPERGRVVAGGRVLFDAGEGVAVRPDLRPIRGAGQTARLFPTMNVAENVRFGAGAGSAEVYAEVVRLFRLEGLGGRMPRELSGGERQRVSVARAVMAAATLRGGGREKAQGALLLLDEPFSGMDAGLRDVLAVELRGWLRERDVPVLSVSHDVGEAFLLEAEVIRMAEGRVVAQGAAAGVLAEERQAMLRRLGA